MTVCALSALNTFLSEHGLDVCGRAAELHRATQPLVLRLWRSARDSRTRDALVRYLRIQMRLQVRPPVHSPSYGAGYLLKPGERGCWA